MLLKDGNLFALEESSRKVGMRSTVCQLSPPDIFGIALVGAEREVLIFVLQPVSLPFPTLTTSKIPRYHKSNLT
jgi:hypothetical protein